MHIRIDFPALVFYHRVLYCRDRISRYAEFLLSADPSLSRAVHVGAASDVTVTSHPVNVHKSEAGSLFG